MRRSGFLTRVQEDDTTTVFRPQLTSLIDVMTFLLVFLIKSFSVDGNIITPASNLDLPTSTSPKKPQPSLSIEITKNAVLCEGEVLSTLDAKSSRDSLLLPGVFHRMAAYKQNHPVVKDPEKVLIQADREIDFSYLKRVMYSCSKAGFSDFTILAVKKE